MTRPLPHFGAALLLVATSLPVSAQAPTPKFLHRTAADWTGQLTAPMPASRRSAAFALGKLGGFASAALPELRKQFRADADAGAREAIVTALGEIVASGELADPETEKLLVEAVQRDPSRYVRRSAACSLGQLGSKNDAVRVALGQAMSDPEQVVRQNAAWALGQLDAKAAPILVAALHDTSSDALVKRDAANALFAVGKQDPALMRPALADLLAMCRDPQPEVRKSALIPLVGLIEKKDATALPVLKEALRDSDVEVRRFAAMALSNIGGAAAADAVPVLLDALRHGDPNVKRSAAVAMHNLGDVAGPAVPDLISALETGDTDLRRSAALALGGIGKAAAKAVPSLVQVLTNGELPRDLRIEAAEALTRMGNIPAVQQQLPTLLKVLGNAAEDGDLRVRLAWLFNDFVNHAPSMNAAKPVMEQVCSEPVAGKNGSARYHCAYLLAIAFRQQAPDSALNVLGEWLLDDTGRLYGNKRTKAGTFGSEIKEDEKVNAVLEGDSRTMAVEVLRFVGSARVGERKDIMAQLRRLADDAKSVPELRKKSRELLTFFNR